MSRQTRQPVAFQRYAILVALTACLFSSFDAHAKPKDKKNRQPTTGRIEISTDPGGYPITIDGINAGQTADYVRAIELDPGVHTVAVVFPDNTRWSQVFNVVAGRKNCVALNYKPHTVTIPPLGGTDPSFEGGAETVELSDVMGTVCDCGEIPSPPRISKVPWWKRAAAKAAGKK